MNWSCSEIKVTMEGLGSFSVYPQYGTPRTRLVQGLASRIGGMLWLEVENDGDVMRVPVPSPDSHAMCGSGTSEGSASYAANLIAAAIAAEGYEVFASTATGPRHRITVSCLAASPEDERQEDCDPNPAGTTLSFRDNF